VTGGEVEEQLGELTNEGAEGRRDESPQGEVPLMPWLPRSGFDPSDDVVYPVDVHHPVNRAR
jgi:hypothetical protein